MKLHELRTFLKFLLRASISTTHPLLAHVVVTRRCNLSCTYCNEYDKVSEPVQLAAMKRRIESLAMLKTSAITCTGGEPLLHPEIYSIIESIRSHGIVATIITNGYLLTEKRIKRFNDLGLNELQISIDNIEPDDVSHKSLKVLDRKLQLLAEHANFKININSVLGLSDERTEDAKIIAKRAKSYGFSSTVGLLHDDNGILKPLSAKQREVYNEIGKHSKSFWHYFNYATFQKNLIEGKTNNWKCRAGARYLYVCEYGLVHWCSQQRGYPGIPLEEYTVEDIKREYKTQKDCSDFCTVSCVQQMSFIDQWRSKQTLPDPHAVPVEPYPLVKEIGL
ncbi:MAG: radical SAM protein [bacterium]